MHHPRASLLRIAIFRAVVPDTRNNNSGTSHHRVKAADGTALVGTRAAEIIRAVGIRTGVSLVIQRKGKGGRGHSRGTVVLQLKVAGAANRGTGNLHHSKAIMADSLSRRCSSRRHEEEAVVSGWERQLLSAVGVYSLAV